MIIIWSWLICTNHKQTICSLELLCSFRTHLVEMYHLRILHLNYNAQIIVDQASHLIFIINIASLFYAHRFMRKLIICKYMH